MVLDPAPDVDESAQRALGTGGARMQQDSIAETGGGVDALADSAHRVPAVERHAGQEEMRERVQHHVSPTRVLRILELPPLRPRPEALLELEVPIFHAKQPDPVLNRFL